MDYSEQTVIRAFQIYTKLAKNGVVGQEEVQLYNADDRVRALLGLFSKEVDSVII